MKKSTLLCREKKYKNGQKWMIQVTNFEVEQNLNMTFNKGNFMLLKASVTAD